MTAPDQHDSNDQQYGIAQVRSLRDLLQVIDGYLTVFAYEFGAFFFR